MGLKHAEIAEVFGLPRTPAGAKQVERALNTTPDWVEEEIYDEEIYNRVCYLVGMSPAPKADAKLNRTAWSGHDWGKHDAVTGKKFWPDKPQFQNRLTPWVDPSTNNSCSKVYLAHKPDCKCPRCCGGVTALPGTVERMLGLTPQRCVVRTRQLRLNKRDAATGLQWLRTGLEWLWLEARPARKQLVSQWQQQESKRLREVFRRDGPPQSRTQYSPQDPRKPEDSIFGLGMPNWNRVETLAWLEQFGYRIRRIKDGDLGPSKFVVGPPRHVPSILASFDPPSAQPEVYLWEKRKAHLLTPEMRIFSLREPLVVPRTFKPATREKIQGEIYWFDEAHHVAFNGGIRHQNYGMTWRLVSGAVTVEEQERRKIMRVPAAKTQIVYDQQRDTIPSERRPFENFMPWEICPPGLFQQREPMQGCMNRPETRDSGNGPKPMAFRLAPRARVRGLSPEALNKVYREEILYKTLCRFPLDKGLCICKRLRESPARLRPGPWKFLEGRGNSAETAAL
jgi:hypothetical protein